MEAESRGGYQGWGAGGTGEISIKVQDCGYVG